MLAMCAFLDFVFHKKMWKLVVEAVRPVSRLKKKRTCYGAKRNYKDRSISGFDTRKQALLEELITNNEGGYCSAAGET